MRLRRWKSSSTKRGRIGAPEGDGDKGRRTAASGMPTIRGSWSTLTFSLAVYGRASDASGSC
eukprot:5580625-Pyramimonas_sp.AAC.1